MENAVKIKNDVITIGKELNDLKGKDTLVLDLTNDCSWSSYFIISTCSSRAHLKGLIDETKTLVYSLGYSINQSKKNYDQDSWILLDCGDFVVHLMTEQHREFYNLEDRWSNSQTIYSSSKLS